MHLNVRLPYSDITCMQILEGVCQPLRLRVEQVLFGSPPVLLSFQLYQLLAFYLVTIQQLMRQKASLLDTITAMRDLAHSNFQQQVRNWTDKLNRSPLAIPKDLSCPVQVLDVLKQIMEVVDAFESDMNQGVSYTSVISSEPRHQNSCICIHTGPVGVCRGLARGASGQLRDLP